MLLSTFHTSFYIGLGIGLATISEIVLIPGVYIGWINGIPLSSLFIFSLSISLLSDTFWYCLGRYFPKRKLFQFQLFRREKERVKPLQSLYEKHKLRMTLYSKFMYGTQIFFQIMAGANRIPFWKYIHISILGTILWFLIATLFGITIGWSIGEVKDTVIGIEIALSVTVLLGLISYVSLRYFTQIKTSTHTKRTVK